MAIVKLPTIVPKYRNKYSHDRRVKKDCELILKNICMEQGYKIHAIEIVTEAYG